MKIKSTENMREQKITGTVKREKENGYLFRIIQDHYLIQNK